MCKTFGKFIKQKRLENNISSRNLAKAIGISSVYMSSIENGHRSAPANEILLKLIDFFRLNTDEIAKFYDLACKTKPTPTVPYDIADYLRDNPKLREMIRASQKLMLTNEDWDKIYTEFIDSNE